MPSKEKKKAGNIFSSKLLKGRGRVHLPPPLIH